MMLRNSIVKGSDHISSERAGQRGKTIDIPILLTSETKRKLGGELNSFNNVLTVFLETCTYDVQGHKRYKDVISALKLLSFIFLAPLTSYLRSHKRID